MTSNGFDPGRINDLLSYHNVSQNRLSIYSGYSRSYISRCFDGLQKPSEQFIKDINRAVNELTGARTFNYKEMGVVKDLIGQPKLESSWAKELSRPSSMTDREWKQFLEKLE